ncbi:Helix-turn-helix domain-containing protein [Arachidicoccus rhizosphaerae]|uniref:Helix-turn-helix domain-containing protein n=1 Tax=Arachidicoccus rhizosphaerae TaxID=551991 RepID=A0A1H3YW01_9BACT|nr:helix-turn-helix domain-containing protein [Arachidicoccus rhizosphaerae]SEA15204.1 Helix-turn-helix domain-containing protein [Arachidicoccus rhizosphaerae]
MGYLRNDHLVTVDDLENLKEELLVNMRQIFAGRSEQPVKKWLKASEARKLLGFSPGKLQVVRDSGLLTFSKIGGNIYYDRDDLMALFEKSKVAKK